MLTGALLEPLSDLRGMLSQSLRAWPSSEGALKDALRGGFANALILRLTRPGQFDLDPQSFRVVVIPAQPGMMSMMADPDGYETLRQRYMETIDDVEREANIAMECPVPSDSAFGEVFTREFAAYANEKLQEWASEFFAGASTEIWCSS